MFCLVNLLSSIIHSFESKGLLFTKCYIEQNVVSVSALGFPWSPKGRPWLGEVCYSRLLSYSSLNNSDTNNATITTLLSIQMIVFFFQRKGLQLKTQNLQLFVDTSIVHHISAPHKWGITKSKGEGCQLDTWSHGTQPRG